MILENINTVWINSSFREIMITSPDNPNTVFTNKERIQTQLHHHSFSWVVKCGTFYQKVSPWLQTLIPSKIDWISSGRLSIGNTKLITIGNFPGRTFNVLWHTTLPHYHCFGGHHKGLIYLCPKFCKFISKVSPVEPTVGYFLILTWDNLFPQNVLKDKNSSPQGFNSPTTYP